MVCELHIPVPECTSLGFVASISVDSWMHLRNLYMPVDPVPQLELVVSFPLMLGHLNGKCWNTHWICTNLLNVPVPQKIWRNPSECNTEHLTWILKTENHLDIDIESPCTRWRCPDDRDHLSLFATSSRRVSRYRPSKAWENCPSDVPPVLSCASCWNGDLQTNQHVWVWMVMVGVQP